MVDFLAGISGIHNRPKVEPNPRAAGGVQREAKAARKEAIMNELRGGPDTLEHLAAVLKQPETTCRTDIAELIREGLLREVWEGKTRYLRRSTL